MAKRKLESLIWDRVYYRFVLPCGGNRSGNNFLYFSFFNFPFHAVRTITRFIWNHIRKKCSQSMTDQPLHPPNKILKAILNPYSYYPSLVTQLTTLYISQVIHTSPTERVPQLNNDYVVMVGFSSEGVIKLG